MFKESLKIKIIKKIFKKFKIDPLIFAYNQIGILNWENEYLSGEAYFVKEVLPEKISDLNNPVFFDVGANVGRYTESLLKTFNHAEVHSFEPLPSCVIKLNRLSDKYTERIVINDLCVSNEEGRFFINTYSNDLESEHASLYQDVLKTIHHSGEVRSIPVTATTIDKYCEIHKIHKIDFLKIDTEGNEFKVLLGAKRMLSEKRISIIQFEFNEMNVISRTFFKDFFDLLIDNYNLYRLHTNDLIPLREYDTSLEVFRFQNIIAFNKNF
ncbi:FkbM family methyltransferase [Pedobacter nyackensis]|uniref:FkbM family methyltransferase n=1 Tax=Pedobacter nyackensis TaxID=475255 RepID=UPI002930BD8F|nr:FkbM family methyltransferase [Pedobacter nyackensis]